MEFNLADIFESVVDAIPEREALVVEGNRRTYAELDARANQMAHHLRRAGIKKDDHVGLHLLNGFPYVESMLGCLKIRAVPINVNYRYVSSELAYIFDEADLVGLVHQREFGPRINEVRTRKLRHFLYVEDGSNAETPGDIEYELAVAAEGSERDFAERSGDDLFIIFTGGTTGRPKGVMWRQEDMFFSALGGGNPTMQPIEKPEEQAKVALERLPMTQFPVPPLIHGAATLGVFIGFNWGDKVALIPKFDAARVWETVEQEKVTSLTIVGDAMARPMAEELAKGSYDASSLMVMSSAGAVLSQSVKEQLRACLPNTMILDTFGSTETGFQGMENGVTSRRFFMNERTSVLDDSLQPLQPGSGIQGKLALRGRIPLGYYNDPAKTKATFVEIGGERWVLPGDIATVEADGSITVFGRGAICINSGGEKVFPEEVEAAVKSHPDIYDAVVVGVPDERWGERVAAVVQLRPDTKPTLEDVVSHCRELIAGYKIPREMHVVDEIARQPSGKPDYPWARTVAGGLGASSIGPQSKGSV
ncbi:MAG: acyl-CoA synthetase [Actinomycetota bacterium]